MNESTKELRDLAKKYAETREAYNLARGRVASVQSDADALSRDLAGINAKLMESVGKNITERVFVISDPGPSGHVTVLVSYDRGVSVLDAEGSRR